MHDPRSVLLKRGSVFLQDTNNYSSSNKTRNLAKKRNGKNNCNGKGDFNNDDKNTPASINPNEQREILFFTHGFIVADFVLKDAFKLFLAVSDREFLTVNSFLGYVRAKFKDMDIDGSGGESYSLYF